MDNENKMNDIEDRQKKLTELGAKARAGTLMSTLFRSIASEKTELMQFKVPGSKTGKMQTRLVSKAEAIVRDIIEKALPYKEGGELVDSKVQMEYRKLILDRVDGRVGAVGEDAKNQGESVSKKVSRLNKDFLNEQAKRTAKEKPKTKSAPPKV